MPIYEYACAACGHKFEEWQKMSDPPVRTCPKCKKKKVEKLISQTAFQLKGGGWYADLYSSSKSGGAKDGASNKDSGGSESGKDATSTKSETKDVKTDGGKKSEAKSEGGKQDSKKKDSPKKPEARAA